MEGGPTNSLVTPMLTDMYQISMTYAQWNNGKTEDHAVFDLFFRKNPFEGEYCIFAGLDEVLKFLTAFRFSTSDIDYLKTIMPTAEEKFFEWLLTLDCSKIKLYAMEEGTVVFPRQPLLRVEGPLAVAQLIETTLLNLVNFPSLIATNAARMRLAAGPDKLLLEFGLRRAQGPDGGVSASKYSYLGGFNGTSNVMAGKLFGIDVKGTHAHSFVMSYIHFSDLQQTTLVSRVHGGERVEFVQRVLERRQALGWTETSESELVAFIAYAQAFPDGFLALVDTFNTLLSGVRNFICVGWVLHELGYTPRGIRLDSGDLSYLSLKVRELFRKVDAEHRLDLFARCAIVASNDINEDVLLALNRHGHAIDTFGIGTHLVTCQRQPALGCVYKLVEINGKPRIKLSNEVEKLVIPCSKSIYRLFGSEGHSLVDLIQTSGEKAPEEGVRIMIRHPFTENKRAYVTPSKVVPLLGLVYDGANGGAVSQRTLNASREFCQSEIKSMREDHMRPLNPTPYKVSISQHLYEFMHNLWLEEAPIADLN